MFEITPTLSTHTDLDHLRILLIYAQFFVNSRKVFVGIVIVAHGNRGDSSGTGEIRNEGSQIISFAFYFLTLGAQKKNGEMVILCVFFFIFLTKQKIYKFYG